MESEGLLKVFINTLAWTLKPIFKRLLVSKDEEKAAEVENKEVENNEDNKDVVVQQQDEKPTHERTNTEVALILLTISFANLLFIALGGFLFKNTEGEYQGKTRQHVKGFTMQHCERLKALYKYDGPEATDIIRDGIKNFTNGIYEYVHEQKWDGGDDADDVENWSYTASLLYSLIVVSCIGYGDTAPISMNGRLLTIIYALIGIPLLLLMIAVMGDKMGMAFKYFYWNITCRDRKQKNKQKKEEGQDGVKPIEEEDEEKAELEKVESGVSLGGEFPGDEDIDEGTAKQRAKKQSKAEAARIQRKMIKEMLIPLHISVLVFAGYNLMGAALFAFLEEKWSFFESFYFSVITLTTVGFGDYVFGKACKEEPNCVNSEAKLIFGFFYILVGLSMVSMCFSHMAQTFKHNFYDIGVMLGVLKKRKTPDPST